MKKRFRTKKVHSYKILIFIIIAIISFYISYSLLFNTLINKYFDKEKLTTYLLNNNVNFKKSNSVDDIINTGLKNPMNLLNFNFSNILAKKNNINNDVIQAVIETPKDENKSEELTKKPLVYIYSTHQNEEYSMSYIEAYSITPTVMLASYILKERLNDLNIPTIVETKSMSDVRNENNWTYAQGYRASRLLMTKAKENYPSLVYFIDLHRDAISKEVATAKIDNISYAKVMFVVGKDADKYKENFDFVSKINEKIKENYKDLTRGIFFRESSSSAINGIYNQDFNNRTILIELGCQYNTIEEVSNTINILSKALFDIIGDENEKG